VSGDHCVDFRGEEMAGQAGWYRAPGEAGLLRYWNGTSWTDHRQPVLPNPVLPEYEPEPIFAPTPHPQFGTTALAQAPTVITPVAPMAVDSSHHRRRAPGPVHGMGLGVAIIVIGLVVIALMSAFGSVGTGELKASGIVTSLGATSDNACTPIARFAVEGRSYTANSATGISPCPVGLGQTVDIVYSATDPAADARIDIGTGITQFLWLLPVLGALVFLGSLWAFHRRRIVGLQKGPEPT
jgi:Protein of unknown function (DUF2510)